MNTETETNKDEQSEPDVETIDSLREYLAQIKEKASSDMDKAQQSDYDNKNFYWGKFWTAAKIEEWLDENAI